MSESRDKKPATDDPAADADKRSGRVSFDSRGNSVWEWQVQTGVYSRDVNTQNVKKLDLDHLSLEDSAIRELAAEEADAKSVAKNSPPKTKAAAKAGGGFNPYDNAATFKTAKIAAKPVRVVKSAPAEAGKPGLWAKLKALLGIRD